MLRKGKHHSSYLQKAWNKYGEHHFEFNVLETCEYVKDTILFLEQKYLDLNPEYNICKNARNTQGVVFSEERKRKIGVANSRRFITEETKEKHRRNGLASPWAVRQMKAVYMLDPVTRETLKEFKSLTRASVYLGKRNGRINIQRVLDGRQKQAYGFFWKLKENNNDI
jgi:hypothetical protein